MARAQAAFDLRLRSTPQRVVNYSQAGHADLDPFRAIPQAITPFALFAVRIAAPLAASPHQSTDIERVVENAGRLLRGAANGRGVPLAAARTGYVFGVEAGSSLDRGCASGKLCKDAFD